MMGGTIDSIVEKEAKSRSEIDKAISGQYENRPVELKKGEKDVYFNGRKISGDGANESDYAREQDIKVDYSKSFEEIGKNQEKKYEPSEEIRGEKQTEERKGEMAVEELKEFVDDTFVESMVNANNKRSYEDKERFYTKIMFPEGGVWFRYQEATSSFRHRNTDFRLYNMLN